MRMLGEHCMTGDVPSQLFSNSLALAQSTRPALRDRASARTSEHCVYIVYVCMEQWQPKPPPKEHSFHFSSPTPQPNEESPKEQPKE